MKALIFILAAVLLQGCSDKQYDYEVYSYEGSIFKIMLVERCTVGCGNVGLLTREYNSVEEANDIIKFMKEREARLDERFWKKVQQ